jgi:hypothetical protein
MSRTRWLGRLLVVAAVVFLFMSTAGLAASLARPRAPSEACCRFLGRSAVDLKNLLLDGVHFGHRCLHRAIRPAADSARQATTEVHLGRYAAGIE